MIIIPTRKLARSLTPHRFERCLPAMVVTWTNGLEPNDDYDNDNNKELPFATNRLARRMARQCRKCGQPCNKDDGVLVRALGGTFHYDCFVCEVGKKFQYLFQRSKFPCAFPDQSFWGCVRLCSERVKMIRSESHYLVKVVRKGGR